MSAQQGREVSANHVIASAVVQATMVVLEIPEPIKIRPKVGGRHLTNARLRKLAEKYPPAPSWYENDEPGLH